MDLANIEVVCIHSLYRSFGWTILRDVPYSAIQFGVAEFVSRHLGWEGSFASGMIVGALAGIATNPMDVLKTRKQLGMKNLTGGGVSWAFLGVVPRTSACAL